ncbi:hypothetical protein MWH28_04105 [Natroniella sulfidigena]|uniref:hypothetical protein n=1 Tax=Natroniella sulfidigena TaxID=723921 RepID=UPI00200AE03F|nr:hypothetical protein [Natroniella sulfidigena]MCK8816551.1 hypothetical protein [Natroniella sulfidigena]
MLLKPGNKLKGVVLELKEESVIIKFDQRAIEAQKMADLKVGQKVTVEVKGWYQGKLVLKLLTKGSKLSATKIDVKV